MNVTDLSVEERTCLSVGVKAIHGKVENLKHLALAAENKATINNMIFMTAKEEKGSIYDRVYPLNGNNFSMTFP